MFLPKFALEQIEQIVLETLERQGWVMPEDVYKYTTKLLTYYWDKPNWQPQPSYAECYLKINDPHSAQRLGDACFFTRAVFPELGTHRGIDSSYYVNLGQGCYTMLLQYTQDTTIAVMRDHFEFLAEMIYTAIHAQGNFRSMWE